MSAPAIVGSFLMEGKEAIEKDYISHLDVLPSVAGILVAAVVGYFSITFMLKLITRVPFLWFALYVAVIGLVFLVLQLTDASGVPPFAVPVSLSGAV